MLASCSYLVPSPPPPQSSRPYHCSTAAPIADLAITVTLLVTAAYFFAGVDIDGPADELAGAAASIGTAGFLQATLWGFGSRRRCLESQRERQRRNAELPPGT